MKHIACVSRTLPTKAYELPESPLGIRSLTDVIVLIGLALEKYFDWIFGAYIIPEDLRP